MAPTDNSPQMSKGFTPAAMIPEEGRANAVTQSFREPGPHYTGTGIIDVESGLADEPERINPALRDRKPMPSTSGRSKPLISAVGQMALGWPPAGPLTIHFGWPRRASLPVSSN